MRVLALKVPALKRSKDNDIDESVVVIGAEGSLKSCPTSFHDALKIRPLQSLGLVSETRDSTCFRCRGISREDNVLSLVS